MNLPPLREYQAQAHRDTLRLLADLRSEGQTERVLNVAPCGAGKTRLGLEHVERGGAQRAVGETRQYVGFVLQAAAAGIDQHGRAER